MFIKLHGLRVSHGQSPSNGLGSSQPAPYQGFASAIVSAKSATLVKHGRGQSPIQSSIQPELPKRRCWLKVFCTFICPTTASCLLKPVHLATLFTTGPSSSKKTQSIGIVTMFLVKLQYNMVVNQSILLLWYKNNGNNGYKGYSGLYLPIIKRLNGKSI